MTETIEAAVELHDLRPTFEDVSEALAVIRGHDDDNRWNAGDLVKAWMEGVERGSRAAELGRLADAAGYAYGGLRDRYDCSAFWPPERRMFDLAWSYYNRARRGADLATASHRLKYAQDNAIGIDEFSDYCRPSELPTKDPPLSDALLHLAGTLADLSARKDVSGNEALALLVRVMMRATRRALARISEAVN